MLSRIIANVTDEDCNGNTPLHLAACKGNNEVLKHLLQFIFDNKDVSSIDMIEAAYDEKKGEVERKIQAYERLQHLEEAK